MSLFQVHEDQVFQTNMSRAEAGLCEIPAANDEFSILIFIIIYN